MATVTQAPSGLDASPSAYLALPRFNNSLDFAFEFDGAESTATVTYTLTDAPPMIPGPSSPSSTASWCVSLEIEEFRSVDGCMIPSQARTNCYFSERTLEAPNKMLCPVQVRESPAPLLALPVQNLLLAGYFGVVYVTKGSQGYCRCFRLRRRLRASGMRRRCELDASGGIFVVPRAFRCSVRGALFWSFVLLPPLSVLISPSSPRSVSPSFPSVNGVGINRRLRIGCTRRGVRRQCAALRWARSTVASTHCILTRLPAHSCAATWRAAPVHGVVLRLRAPSPGERQARVLCTLAMHPCSTPLYAQSSVPRRRVRRACMVVTALRGVHFPLRFSIHYAESLTRGRGKDGEAKTDGLTEGGGEGGGREGLEDWEEVERPVNGTVPAKREGREEGAGMADEVCRDSDQVPFSLTRDVHPSAERGCATQTEKERRHGAERTTQTQRRESKEEGDHILGEVKAGKEGRFMANSETDSKINFGVENRLRITESAELVFLLERRNS
ncbi:hypothetical protein FB451DRAFT_1381792 [Mycena latifolia]|nr:hypothetical protein FB451DRAFT_1381792 [Mycena latifolia]